MKLYAVRQAGGVKQAESQTGVFTFVKHQKAEISGEHVIFPLRE